MEPITKSPETSLKLQQQEITTPNQTKWEAFYNKFEPEQKKQFISNQSYFFTQMIQKALRKSKEALRKLRENER